MDLLLRGLLRPPGGDAVVRVVAVITTASWRESAERHRASTAAGVALARAGSAALLLATLTKGDERVTLQLLGDGALRGITAEASDTGDWRAYASAPRVAGPPAGGRLRLAPLIGAGTLVVIRDLGLRERYQGSTALVSGEIDEDVEHYLSSSEQVVSALGCDAVPGGGAGGVLVQCLPGGDVDAVARARARLRGGAVFDALASGAADPASLARAALGLEPEVLDVRRVRFRCPCTRERVTGALALCGEAELRDMLARDGGAEVTCNFCNTRYGLSGDELRRLIEQVHSLAKA
jgi:molecular chaperone Hsp33